MWAIGRYDLRVSDSEFWWLTPRQFAALARRHYQAERRLDLRMGVVASVIANVNRDPKKRPAPFTALDFFPDPEEQELKPLTLDALKRELIASGATIRHRSHDG